MEDDERTKIVECYAACDEEDEDDDEWEECTDVCDVEHDTDFDACDY